MFLSGSKITLEQRLMARAVDELAWQSWAKTKDAQRNCNRPESVLKKLTEDREPETEVFLTAEDFKAEWEKICRTVETQ